MTSRSSIYLATTTTAERDDVEHGADPLYENSTGQVTIAGPQRPRRRKQRVDESVENTARGTTTSKKRESLTICRSVSFLQKKTYHECFNGAIDPKLQARNSNDVASENQEEAAKGMCEAGVVSQSTDGVEWECQQLSLYLGLYRFRERILFNTANRFIAWVNTNYL